MKATGNATIVINIAGDTGYSNNSRLFIEIPALGEIALPNDEWDLTPILKLLNKTNALELSIPSGVLKLGDGYDRPVAVTINEDEHTIEFQGQFSWDGKGAGLFGGMSGYAHFSVSEVQILDSVFASSWQSLSLEQYNQRMMRHRDLHDGGWEAALLVEQEIATIKNTPRGDRDSNQVNTLRKWFDHLEWLDSDEATLKMAEIEEARRAQYEEEQRQREERRKQKLSQLDTEEDYYEDEDYDYYEDEDEDD